MKKLLLVLLFAAVILGVKAFLNELEQPAEGEVVVTETEVVVVDETPVEEEVVIEEEVEAEEEDGDTPAPAPSFEPLPFDGNIKAFMKKYGGSKYRIKKESMKKFFGKGAKAAILPSGDIYVVTKSGALYVVHNNKPLKLS